MKEKEAQVVVATIPVVRHTYGLLPGDTSPWSRLRPASGANTSWPARLPAALADAVAWILLLDVLLSLLPGHGSIAFIFFHLPNWVPAAPLIPAAIAAGILLRFRPAIVAAIAIAASNAAAYLVLRSSGAIGGWPARNTT